MRRNLFAALMSGPPSSVTIGGVTYQRIKFGDSYLDVLISSQPLYMRPAS